MMRERVTFLHAPDDAFDPEQLQLQNDSLRVQSLKAAREDKLTLGLYELPQEVSNSKSKPIKATPSTTINLLSSSL